MKTHQRVEAGTAVRVALALPHQEGPRFCTLVGTVVRVERDERGVTRGLGVQFLDEHIADIDRRCLEGFLCQRTEPATIESM